MGYIIDRCIRKHFVSTRTTPQKIMDAETAIAEALAVFGLKELKEKQKEAVMTFVQGHDTFVALPTGYGKSIIYAILPLVFDKSKGMRGNTLAFSLLLVFNNRDITLLV